ncbi:MerR family transcriptional regulator [Fusibacter ferrireducens]|uniref:MerR family DNA-binding transcriptional regulator n=1 Tax=Fusibacter ferrireducens TaxID=2785058 RepID=A0ABR9ZU72_9FIRM|nr:MerR family DNA-binding transcriptional regulator [Fusibacter ferrireducens]MBF4693511.1 MerR family DNA-binding transcriptional regulator [Fusibacter ferrireducens]
MKDKFLIGELAKMFNISTDTLRHYDRIGLLKPECDPNNDYRYYDIRSFFKLSRILFFKNLDISLEEINRYMKHKNTSNLVSLLKRKEEEIDHKINRLMNLKNKIQTKLELLENIDNELDEIKIKRIPARRGIFLDMNDVASDYEIKKAFKANEQYLKTSSWLIEGQIYTSLSKENMDQGIFTRFRYFIEVVSVDSEQFSQTVEIPEQDCACITFEGPYCEMPKYYEVLTCWIRENGYVIAGDSIEKNIVDYDFSDSEYEYVSEIQIPIERASQV